MPKQPQTEAEVRASLTAWDKRSDIEEYLEDLEDWQVKPEQQEHREMLIRVTREVLNNK